MSEYGFFIGFFLVIVFLAVTEDENGRGYFAQYATTTPASFVGHSSTSTVPVSDTFPKEQYVETMPYLPQEPYFYVTLSTGEEVLMSETDLRFILGEQQEDSYRWGGGR